MTNSCRLSAGQNSENDGPVGKKKPSGFPVVTFATLLIAFIGLYWGQGSAGIVIAVLSLATISLIIYGERFRLDRALEARGLPGRDAFLPVVALVIALVMGAVQPGIIPEVIDSKLQIIVMILSFAILAEGISRSGFFAFAAYKIVHNCQGNTTTLTLYLYILTSILTLLTTNDVVVLVMTPVIISICANAGIRNARLLLLSEFVAANTMSMASLIGSPTNIIVGLGLKVTFFTYLLLMFVPAVLAGMLSLIVLDWVIKQCSKRGNWFFGRWAFDNSYRIPAIAHHLQFNGMMKRWLALFALSMVLVAVISGLKMSLLYAALPIAGVSLAVIYMETNRQNGHKAASFSVAEQIKALPYSVFFFGMTFFIFSAQMVKLDYITQVVVPFIKDHVLNDLVGASLGSIMASGLLVNLINDLPAAAFLTDLFQHIDAGGMHIYMRLVLIQSLLVGLNIGCYVTPIGALAGLLWFNIIGREERRRQRQHAEAQQAGLDPRPLENIAMPDRCDLVRFGIINFMVVAIALGILMPFFAEIIDMLINSPEHSTKTPLIGMISLYSYLPYIGSCLVLFVFLRFREVLKNGNVLLGHMREVFVVMTRLTIWSMQNRSLYLGLLIMIFIFMASSLLFWAETAHDTVYGLADGAQPFFDKMSNFVIWLMLFTTTGLGGAYTPHSALGLAMTSLLPMMVIGGVVLVAQLSSNRSIQRLSQSLANGEIPSYRIAIVNYSHRCEQFVEEVLFTRDASILLLCSSGQYDRAIAFCNRINTTARASHRVYAVLKNADPYFNYQEYRLGETDEIYLLSDMSEEGEYENLSYISRLDTAFNTDISAAVQTGANITSIGLPQTNLQDDPDYLSSMPKVFIEVSSTRFQDLVQKSCSPRLLKNSLQMTFDVDLAEFLFSDIDESTEMLNAYYRLGRPLDDPSLFVNGKNPLEKSIIKIFDLDEKSKEIFRAHFSGTKTEAAARLTGDMRALRQIAIQMIGTVSQNTAGAQYIDGSVSKAIDYSSLLGVVMHIKGGGYMHLGIPSAATSMQSVAVEKVMLRQEISAVQDTHPQSSPKPRAKIGKTGNIFIFNLNPEALSFIRALLPALSGMERRIILLCNPAQIVPEDISKNASVSIIQSEIAEDLVNWICPFGELQNAEKTSKDHPLLQKGDRLYVFLDYNRVNPELPSIDFIYQINRRLQDFSDYAADHAVKPALSHPDIYIAVEMNGPESRFLFENFFIDKIFDAALPRQSYMNILAKIYHRCLSDKSFVGHIHGTGRDFQRAAAMARYLCRFITEYAEDIKLRDHTGAEIFLIGKPYAEAAKDICTYSMPPMQLFARVRIEAVLDQGGSPGRKIFQMVGVDDQEPIHKDDLLLNIPVI